MSKPTEYRKNVVGVFKNTKNQYLVGQRVDLPDVWQFPQGGVDQGENLHDAIRREMWEELGIKHFEILRQSPSTVKYDFPEKYLNNPKKGFYKGQEQTWFLLELGENEVPNLELAPDDEFSDVKWSEIEEIIKGTISWKKSAYNDGLKLLGIEVS